MNNNNNTILYATVCINYKNIIAISKQQDHYMTYFTPKILIPQGQVFLTHHHFNVQTFVLADSAMFTYCLLNLFL